MAAGSESEAGEKGLPNVDQTRHRNEQHPEFLWSMAQSGGSRPALLADAERGADKGLLRRGLLYPHLKATFPSGVQNPDVLEACGGVLGAASEQPTIVSFVRGRGQHCIHTRPDPAVKSLEGGIKLWDDVFRVREVGQRRARPDRAVKSLWREVMCYVFSRLH